MKEIIYEYYHIQVKGMIKFSKKSYKIKTENGPYILKIIETDNIQMIYNYIQTLKLTYFVKPLINKNGAVVTKYEHYYFYIIPFFEQDGMNIKGLKLRSYFDKIAYLHNKSFYSEKISNGYYEKLFEELQNTLDQRRQFYISKIEENETKYYKSSSEWLFMLNYNKIMKSLDKSQHYLDKTRRLCEGKNSVRLSLIYNNFDYNHIFLEQDILISVDHMRIDLPIYDVYQVYQRMDDVFFDLDELISTYLKKVILYDYEKSLLSCLLLLVPIVYFTDDEIENVIVLTRLFYYLSTVDNVIKILNIKTSQ